MGIPAPEFNLNYKFGKASADFKNSGKSNRLLIVIKGSVGRICVVLRKNRNAQKTSSF